MVRLFYGDTTKLVVYDQARVVAGEQDIAATPENEKFFPEPSLPVQFQPVIRSMYGCKKSCFSLNPEGVVRAQAYIFQ